MWKCKKCGEELEDTFDTCWQCSTPDDGTSPRLPASSTPAASSSRTERGSSAAPTSVTKRYSDAYLVARAITGIGVLVKRIALILGGGILLISLFVLSRGDSSSTAFALMGIVAAFVAAIPIYILGILVAAQGEILKATLDTAVTNSPFLKTDEMAKVMSLRP